MIVYGKEKEVLRAQKRSLAAWINNTIGATVVDADNLMSKLSTGVILCKLAKCIQRQAEDSLGKDQVSPAAPMKFWDRARRETFFARDNAELFIRWCRGFGVREAVLFESDGLVMQTHQRTVILCLLELARIAAGCGVLLPPPIQLSPTATITLEEQGGSSEDELLFEPPPVSRCCCDSGCSSGGRSPDPKTSSPGSTLKKGVVLLVSSSKLPVRRGNSSSKLPVRVSPPRVSPPRSASGVGRETISSRLRTLSRSDSSIVSSRSSLIARSAKEPRSKELKRRQPEQREVQPRRRKVSPLDRRVSEIACQYLKDADRIRRLSEGHYSFLDKNVFLRMVRGQNVVVRIGGGWDTLEHFLSTLTGSKGSKTNLRRRVGPGHGG